MAKPTEQELAAALEEAQRMREGGEDPHCVAKALLNLHYQSGFLISVLHAAEKYLQSGLAEREHAELIRAIDKFRAVDDIDAHRERSTLGL
jgi:hypothetical protein